MRKPHQLRVMISSLMLCTVVALILLWARSVAVAPSLVETVASVAGAFVVIVLLGSFYEWTVHRYLYHGRSSIPVAKHIYEIHTHGHHWHRFPPNHYVEGGEVERIPVFPPAPFEVAGSPFRRFMAWAWQFALYLVVGIVFAFLPIWVITHNLPFTIAAVLTGLVEFHLFIRVHDVMHYPAGRLMERFAWFKFLDRHHYIHHVDNRANVNFLLPLCDWLFGTLRTELNETEKRYWPTFEEAKKLQASTPLVVRP
jgi:hypothetical protein